MSWKLKLAIIVLATLIAILIVVELEGDFATEARIFLRNLAQFLF